jgi:hypothetical protein
VAGLSVDSAARMAAAEVPARGSVPHGASRVSVRILSDTEAVTCEVSDDAPVDGLLHRRGGSHRCTRWVVAREPGLRSRAAQVGEREDSRPHPQLEVIGDAPRIGRGSRNPRGSESGVADPMAVRQACGAAPFDIGPNASADGMPAGDSSGLGA